MSARCVRSFQNEDLLKIFPFLSNNCQKSGSLRNGTKIVSPCINKTHLVWKVAKLPRDNYMMFSIKMKVSQLIYNRPTNKETRSYTREVTNKLYLLPFQPSIQQPQLSFRVTLKTVYSDAPNFLKLINLSIIANRDTKQITIIGMLQLQMMQNLFFT